MADGVIKRLEAVAAQLESAVANLKTKGGGGGGGGAEDEVPPEVEEYDIFFKEKIQPFIDAAAAIPDAKPIAGFAKVSFEFTRQVLMATGACKQPTQKELVEYVKPIVDAVSGSQKPGKSRAMMNHEKAFGELMQGHNWLLVQRPLPIVKSKLDGAMFYFNRILKEHKGKDTEAPHKTFVQKGIQLLKAWATFVEDNFKGGLKWAGKAPLTGYKPGAPAGVPAAPAAPAAPPMAPCLDLSALESKEPPKKAPGGMGAVFAEINKKGGDTGGAKSFALKKVTADMKTKNIKNKPAVVPKKKAPAPTKRVAKPAVKKPPVLQLRQGTWFCENYDSEQVSIDGVKMNQNVYIFNASNTTIQVPGKVKSITIDKAIRCRVFVHDIVSSLEIVNCERAHFFLQGKSPSVSIDKSNGCIMHISAETMKEAPNFITSKISEMNVEIPGPSEEADPIELPIPEQYVTKIVGNKLETVVWKHG